MVAATPLSPGSPRNCGHSSVAGLDAGRLAASAVCLDSARSATGTTSADARPTDKTLTCSIRLGMCPLLGLIATRHRRDG